MVFKFEKCVTYLKNLHFYFHWCPTSGSTISNSFWSKHRWHFIRTALISFTRTLNLILYASFASISISNTQNTQTHHHSLPPQRTARAQRRRPFWFYSFIAKNAGCLLSRSCRSLCPLPCRVFWLSLLTRIKRVQGLSVYRSVQSAIHRSYVCLPIFVVGDYIKSSRRICVCVRASAAADYFSVCVARLKK